jgi:hypothetical protein
MTDQISSQPNHVFPSSRKQSILYTLSLLVALLLILASVVGLITPTTLYLSEEARQSFLPNDVINLVIGLPFLLVSIWLARKQRLIGLLLWPGALLYILYNYIVNLLGVPFGWITLVYLPLVLLPIYQIWLLLSEMDRNGLKDRLVETVPTKIPAWFLVIFGILFLFRGLNLVITAGSALPLPEIGLLIADMVISTAWIVGGIFLIRQNPIGYASGLGLLFGASMLFIGLILLLIIRPFVIGIPLVLSDLVVIVGMSLFCFIPTWLYLQGVVRCEKFALKHDR